VVGRLPTVTATVDGGGRPGDDFPSPARKSIIVDRRHVRTWVPSLDVLEFGVT
jgi:hypothetical protein